MAEFNEITPPPENKPELNHALRNLLKEAVVLSKRNFVETNPDIENKRTKQYLRYLDLLYNSVATDRYSIREQYLQEDNHTLYMKLVPTKKIKPNSFNKKGAPNIILNDGDVPEIQIVITRFDGSKDNTRPEYAMGLKGYDIDFSIHSVSYKKDVGVKFSDGQAGIGIRVFNDGSATSKLRNYLGKSVFELVAARELNKTRINELSGSNAKNTLNYLSNSSNL
jgi:hypothetical protein